ncbi:YdeI/OmpD-associated family protein [Aquiflexum lacus]|uniref:YdeI/OmpD-associated family protein n=1 Tax=Aquiflexum lacus TaxID=2483805 RepID=UPI00189574B0|nr:YdeI/OmpD-associated family protein [Aquiflexum lacus]
MTTHWQEEIELIKSVVEKTELQHAIKWGIDVYTLNGQNIIGIAPFKAYIGIWFYNGVFMSDPLNVFVNAQEGKTKALRQWRFTSKDEINPDQIYSYLLEAIANEKAGKRLVPDRSAKFEIPELLQKAFEEDAELKDSFFKLSPGKQKEYALHIQESKREETKISRLEKIKPMILEGKGLNDKYK